MRQILLVTFLLGTLQLIAQPPSGVRRGAGAGAGMNAGHLYGKVVDKANKGIEAASVQLISNRPDTTKATKETILKTVVSAPNGDFSLENLPVFGTFKLKISAIGHKTLEQNVSFGIKPQSGGNMQDMMGMLDKDLGNIKLETDPATLANVTVTTTRRMFEMGVDRKIFNVEKNLTSSGGTATEVMKSIPSLSVDIDGNVTMRNATPQLFVDGRPTTLTMDQIPADIIDQVELITNPSAKFDASGGNAGILNIVLKKNKKTGYNGGVRVGTDTRGGFNLSGDINVRQNKINFFGGGNLFHRRSKSWSTTDRLNLTQPTSQILQDGTQFNKNLFGFGRAGFDYFIDIRNTLSVTVNYGSGNSNNEGDQRTDSIRNAVLSSYNDIDNTSNGNFKNLGSQLSFKHNFAKNGHVWTADANYNARDNDNSSVIATETFPLNGRAKTQPVYQKSLSRGDVSSLVIQTDYSNPITENQKLELGLRTSIQDVNTENEQFFYNYEQFKYKEFLSTNYTYADKVYAAYSTYSLKKNNWSYQFGLRAESSVYNGRVIKTDSAFEVKYPLSLFPSAFITYKVSDNADMQFNYSRRINRPNFFQLLPFIDYSDPQNISVGNAGLKPEFTNSYEISYNKTYKKGSNFLVSSFLKYNTNLITNYQYLGLNPDVERKYSNLDSAIFNTFINANNSTTYGIELTNRMPVSKWWDNTTNLNIFNSTINLVDPTGKGGDVKTQATSWFIKTNNTFKLPKGYSLQLSADYFSRTVLPGEGGRGGQGGRGGGGGMMWGGGQTGTVQGYINPRYSVDLGVRKEFTLKGGNSASFTLNVNDIFRTQLFSRYSESPFLQQTSQRRRDPQIVRLNFAYRFGKFDVNLFKRRNDRNLDTSGDMIPQ